MLFNSIDFAIFLPIVFILYWFVCFKNLKLQNLLIVVASYVFYGWWDYRFLSLIFFSTILDYSLGLAIASSSDSRKRKLMLILSLCANLGLLGFFKYYNFFAENFAEAFTFFGHPFKVGSLKIILPVGISFYTFQTLSYTIDVYRRKLEPTKDFISFLAFVSFFPQLVAGPIERASNLLPQFFKKRQFNYGEAVDGMRQILWGLFKKVVIADNCAEYANLIFNNSQNYSGSTLFLGAVLFAFQIYGDFSGYSDIAIGTSRLFGFNLMQNFAFPYFSRDIAEFWRRWHISLSTWFRDYLYIPLGGSRGGIMMQLRNTFIIFIVSGFWHGANWTFIAWGAVNAAFFIPLLLTKNNRKNLGTIGDNKNLALIKDLALMLVTFIITCLAWIFFRAENMSHAMQIFDTIFSASLFKIPFVNSKGNLLFLLILISFFVIIEWFGRKNKHALEMLGKWKYRALRWGFYIILISIMGMFMQTEETPFIYFQF